MEIFFKCCKFIESKMAAFILLIALVALFLPKALIWVEMSWINWCLMTVMFAMGLTLKVGDFKLIFLRPREIAIGSVSQFVIMPSLAYILGKIFNLDDALFAGVVLVGTCPGGTASNVATYLAKGDVALSIWLTTVNTLLAPLLTPLITYLLLRRIIEIEVINMFIAILQVVILPIFLGFLFNKFFKRFAKKVVKFVPITSIFAIGLIVASVVSHNAERILDCGLVILIVVILHNLLGYLLGFSVGKFFKLENAKVKALSIEIGMQNAGLATTLASSEFPNLALATVPGAVFSIWHNISGALLASFYSKKIK